MNFRRGSILIADNKWEPPESGRKMWRRLKKDKTYEYRETPPDEVPQKQEKPTVDQDKSKVIQDKPQLKWKPDKNVKHIKPKNHAILDKNLLKEVLDKGYFTILSAGPNFRDNVENKMKKDDEYFHERHLALRDELERTGMPYTEVMGHYEGEEPSFLVFHDKVEMTPKTSKSFMVHHDKKSFNKQRKVMEELGKKFNQDSVLHGINGKNEMTFTTGPKKGETCGNKGWKEVPDAKDFYTDIELNDKNHTKVNLNIKDCFKRKMFDRVAMIVNRIVGDPIDFCQGCFN